MTQSNGDSGDTITDETRFYAPFRRTIGDKSVVLELLCGGIPTDALEPTPGI